ncbi:MAG TPA: polyphenol oxidase family protein [Labilithrix sp.]
MLERAGFSHAFTTRAGGVSKPPFDALDFAILRDADARRENQARLAAAVGFEASRLYQARQVHGRDVVLAEGDPERMLELEADAVVADPASGAAVAARVADCVPVLVADSASGRVAAIHAGWRGVVRGVIDAGIAAMRARPRSGAPDAFVAAIGPCIGPCCFEVGTDVAAEIGDAYALRRDEARGKAFVDLHAVVRAKLRDAGLQDASIDDVSGCTRCDAARFYSYRRDGDRSGRQLGVIVAR